MKAENVTTHCGLAVVQVYHFGDIIPVWPAERSSRPHHRKKQSTVPGRGASACDNGSHPGARGLHLPQSYSKAYIIEIRRPLLASVPEEIKIAFEVFKPRFDNFVDQLSQDQRSARHKCSDITTACSDTCSLVSGEAREGPECESWRPSTSCEGNSQVLKTCTEEDLDKQEH